MTIISLSRESLQSSKEIIRLLGTIFIPEQTFEEKKRILKDVFGIPMTREIEEGITSMCNLSDGILEYGYNMGREKGEIKGSVKTYHRLGYLPSEIVSCIMQDYSLSQEEAEKYVEETLGLQLAAIMQT